MEYFVCWEYNGVYVVMSSVKYDKIGTHDYIFLIFNQKTGMTFHANCLLFPREKKKKNISKCCQLKILPRVLSANLIFWLL